MTNEGLLGYAFDKDTSPQGLELIRINAGSLATSGRPGPMGGRRADADPALRRRLQRREPQRRRVVLPAPADRSTWTPSARCARPRATRLLGLRARHASKIDIPLYAFETDLTNGRVIRGAKRLIKRAKGIKTYKLVTDTKQSHVDPLVASPRRNNFLKTLVPFLKKKQLK